MKSMMKAMLRICMLLLGVAAVCTAVAPMKDFKPDEMEGKWYVIAVASNADWFNRFKHKVNLGTVMVQKTTDGDLHMSCANLRNNGSCGRMQMLAKKSDTPGLYTYYSENWGSNNDLHVVEAKGGEYAFIHIIKDKAGKLDLLNKLYGCAKVLSGDLMSKFTKFSQEMGVLPVNIVWLPHKGECPGE